MGKKLTIYVKSSPNSVGHFCKFNVHCHCGRCVMPECSKCKNNSECNVVGVLRRKGINVVHNNQTPQNREAVIVAQNIRAIKKAYDAAFSAIRLCQCAPKKKTK